MMRVITLLVFMALTSIVQAQTKSLYFLNKPESIVNKQMLANFSVKAGEQIRVFLHYRNASRQHLVFEFETTSKTPGIVGFAFHQSPAIAGATSALQFMQKAKSVNDVSIVHQWKSGQTISGIIEFTSLQDMQVICKTGDTINPKARVSINEAEIYTSIELNTVAQKIRFGGDGIGDNKGNYGVSVNIDVVNKSDKSILVMIYASPRAGNAILTWGVVAKYHNTPMMSAKSKHKIASFTLRTGQTLRFTTMPAGGMSYPIELEFAPRVIQTS